MWELDTLTEEMAKAKGFQTLEEYLEDMQMPSKEEAETRIKEIYKTAFKDKEDYIESVNNNGGFFIGRYEASNNNDSIIVQKDKASWNNISYTTALEKCTSKYTGKSYTCSLLTGAAWDRTLGWIYETGNKTEMQIVGDSKDWGNYEDDTFSRTTGLINTFLATTGLINTGSKEETKANNIYDLAGNVWEWTKEAMLPDYQVFRGGDYDFSASYYPSYFRNNRSPDYTSSGVGFRPAIYL